MLFGDVKSQSVHAFTNDVFVPGAVSMGLNHIEIDEAN
jgi:hypothetical protein